MFIRIRVVLGYCQFVLQREHGGLEADSVFSYVLPVLGFIPCSVQSPSSSGLWRWYLHLVCDHTADVQFSGNHVSDQAGSVFLHEFYLAMGAVNRGIDF